MDRLKLKAHSVCYASGGYLGILRKPKRQRHNTENVASQKCQWQYNNLRMRGISILVLSLPSSAIQQREMT